LRDHIVTKLVTKNRFFKYTYIITPALNVYKQKTPLIAELEVVSQDTVFIEVKYAIIF